MSEPIPLPKQNADGSYTSLIAGMAIDADGANGFSSPPVYAPKGFEPEPLDYLAMQQALADAWLVVTDSGGLQEEAPTFGVPLLVLREETERPEAVEAGAAALVGTDRARIVAEIERLWHDAAAYRRMQQAGNPFGDGQASQRIAGVLQRGLAASATDLAA